MPQSRHNFSRHNSTRYNLVSKLNLQTGQIEQVLEEDTKRSQFNGNNNNNISPSITPPSYIQTHKPLPTSQLKQLKSLYKVQGLNKGQQVPEFVWEEIMQKMGMVGNSSGGMQITEGEVIERESIQEQWEDIEEEWDEEDEEDGEEEEEKQQEGNQKIVGRNNRIPQNDNKTNLNNNQAPPSLTPTATTPYTINNQTYNLTNTQLKLLTSLLPQDYYEQDYKIDGIEFKKYREDGLEMGTWQKVKGYMVKEKLVAVSRSHGEEGDNSYGNKNTSITVNKNQSMIILPATLMTNNKLLASINQQPSSLMPQELSSQISYKMDPQFHGVMIDNDLNEREIVGEVKEVEDAMNELEEQDDQDSLEGVQGHKQTVKGQPVSIGSQQKQQTIGQLQTPVPSTISTIDTNPNVSIITTITSNKYQELQDDFFIKMIQMQKIQTKGEVKKSDKISDKQNEAFKQQKGKPRKQSNQECSEYDEEEQYDQCEVQEYSDQQQQSSRAPTDKQLLEALYEFDNPHLVHQNDNNIGRQRPSNYAANQQLLEKLINQMESLKKGKIINNSNNNNDPSNMSPTDYLLSLKPPTNYLEFEADQRYQGPQGEMDWRRLNKRERKLYCQTKMEALRKEGQAEIEQRQLDGAQSILGTLQRKPLLLNEQQSSASQSDESSTASQQPYDDIVSFHLRTSIISQGLAVIDDGVRNKKKKKVNSEKGVSQSMTINSPSVIDSSKKITLDSRGTVVIQLKKGIKDNEKVISHDDNGSITTVSQTSNLINNLPQQHSQTPKINLQQPQAGNTSSMSIIPQRLRHQPPQQRQMRKLALKEAKKAKKEEKAAFKEQFSQEWNKNRNVGGLKGVAVVKL